MTTTTITTDRSQHTTQDIINELWRGLDLPETALQAVRLPGKGTKGLPSSFKIGQLSQASIALSALSAALVYSERTNIATTPTVTVPLDHAVTEFKSERLYTINGVPPPSAWGTIGGLHRTVDGYVRLHDSFPNHRAKARRLLGCADDADRSAVASKIAKWKSFELEDAAHEAGIALAALRRYEEWDDLPPARAIRDFPIQVRKIADGPLSPGPAPPHRSTTSPLSKEERNKCLHGLRVLEMTRVIAGPIAGKTLAAHGADVLWVTSPNLPNLPSLDRDLSRGKRTIQLDVDDPRDYEKLMALIDEADVFLQSYRPGSLAAKGLSPEILVKRRQARANGGKEGGGAYGGGRPIICANLSAYGSEGPWADRRGFDSLVQTCSGMNVSEAEHFSLVPRVTRVKLASQRPEIEKAAKPTPCQALDHATGYLLATGILAARQRQQSDGGSASYQVDVSLAGVMKYLRSLGQYPGDSGFQDAKDYEGIEDVSGEFLEEKMSGFGLFRGVRHSARVEGLDVGWEVMPKPLGEDEAMWL